MPSPFPGMDPFLEDPGYFHPIHQALIYCFREQLQPLLPAPYYAELEDRTWIEAVKPEPRPGRAKQDEQRVPDVNVLRAELPTPRERTEGGVAVAEQTTTEPVVVHVPHIEMSEWYLNVFARHDRREQIVTTIEVLSRTNKTPGETGRDLYQRKQREILSGKTHLVEIDLLRAGAHATAVPLDALKVRVPTYDYHACVKRFDNVEDYFVYPIRLPERLPILAVPLLPGDGIVPLDLQKAFERAYDTGPYSRRVWYDSDPVPAPALSEEHDAWVKKVLRDRGLLTA
jgi:hypothetical protein